MSSIRVPHLALPLLALLTGCSTATHVTTTALPATTTGFHGAVHGGQQPITGATINIYAVGLTGDGSPAASVLAAPLTTDGNGFFDLTNKITCPSQNSLLYLVATGGNPGFPPPADNLQSSLLVALGPCNNPSNVHFINVNEVTTVAAIYALAPYMSGLTSIGSGPADADALTQAFTLAWQYANITNGTSPGVNIPTGTVIPTAQINTLADLLSACVNSTGGVAGDTSFCGQLFTLLTTSTPPADISMALLNLALNPGLNTTALYNLTLPVAPFQPTIAELPPDFGVRASIPSNFTVSPSSLSFGSTYVGARTPTQTITVTNNTTHTFSITETTISGADPGDFIYTPQAPPDTCPTPMLPGTSCTFPVAFQPTAGGVRHGYFVIHNTSVNPFIPVPLSGTGTVGAAGPITVSPSSLAISGYNLGGSATPITLTNSGSTPLSIQGITFTPSPGAIGYYTETDNCGTTLPGLSSCTINVSAHPILTTNSAATMTIMDDASTGPQVVNLSFVNNGYLPEDTIDFGVYSVGNTGYSQLRITKFPGNTDSTQGISGTLSGTNASDFAFQSSPSTPSTGVCNFSSTICYANLSFTPSALGDRIAYVNFPVGVVPVKGTGVGPGPYFVASAQSGIPYYQSTGYTNYTPTYALQLSAPAGGSQLVTFNVRYTGTVSNPILAPVITGPHAGDFYGSTTCTGSPQLGCTVNLSFSPATSQSYTASGYIADSTDTYRQNFTVTVTAP